MAVTEAGLEACFYCGCIADTIDHFPPTSVWERMNAQGIFKAQQELPCCKECNSWLGPRAPLNLAERKRMVKIKLRRKYGKLLLIPSWSTEALDRLGPNLKEFHEKGLRDKETLQHRLAW